MKVIYRRIWDQQERGDTKPAVLVIDQDWVPAVGTSVFFPDDTAGTVVDVEMRYPKGPTMPYVRVWVK
jgi:hypothetical protein